MYIYMNINAIKTRKVTQVFKKRIFIWFQTLQMSHAFYIMWFLLFHKYIPLELNCFSVSYVIKEIESILNEFLPL